MARRNKPNCALARDERGQPLPTRALADGRAEWIAVDAIEITSTHHKWPRSADPTKHRAWWLAETDEVWRMTIGKDYELELLRARARYSTEAPLGHGDVPRLASLERRAARDAAYRAQHAKA